MPSSPKSRKNFSKSNLRHRKLYLAYGKFSNKKQILFFSSNQLLYELLLCITLDELSPCDLFDEDEAAVRLTFAAAASISLALSRVIGRSGRTELSSISCRWSSLA